MNCSHPNKTPRRPGTPKAAHLPVRSHLQGDKEGESSAPDVMAAGGNRGLVGQTQGRIKAHDRAICSAESARKPLSTRAHSVLPGISCWRRAPVQIREGVDRARVAPLDGRINQLIRRRQCGRLGCWRYGFDSCWCSRCLGFGQFRPVNQIIVGAQVAARDRAIGGAFYGHALVKRNGFFTAKHF